MQYVLNLSDSPERRVDARMGIGWTPADREMSRVVQKRETKATKILARLRCGPATTLELAEIGGVRFGARVAELRQAGHRIVTENRPDYAIYRLEGE